MRCPACGEETASGAVFCSQCGERLSGEESDAPKTPTLYPNPAPPSGKEPVEEVLWQGGYSPKAMIGGWCLSALISIVLLTVGALWIRGLNTWLVLLALALLPWLHHLAILLYRRAGIRYLLTTQQLIHESGIFRRVHNRIETLMMNDIAFTQTILQRMVGVGDIQIISGDSSHPAFSLRGIDNVADVAEIFNEARREERRRHGVHVEQI